MSAGACRKEKEQISSVGEERGKSEWGPEKEGIGRLNGRRRE